VDEAKHLKEMMYDILNSAVQVTKNDFHDHVVFVKPFWLWYL